MQPHELEQVEKEIIEEFRATKVVDDMVFDTLDFTQRNFFRKQMREIESFISKSLSRQKEAIISEAIRLVEAGAGINGRQDIIRDLASLRDTVGPRERCAKDNFFRHRNELCDCYPPNTSTQDEK